MRNYLNFIWLVLVRELKDNIKYNEVMNSYDEKRVRKAMEYIHKHYAENISLENIADEIFISKSECCRSFKRILNMTPFEYLMEYRVFKSTQLLCNSNDSIAIIALSVGFNGISYYGKVFKKYMNCTPSEYRREHKV